MRPRVWITGPIAEAELAPLEAIAAVELRREADPATPAEMLVAAPGLTGMLTVNGPLVNGPVLDAAGPQFRIVANFGVGYDNVDVAAASARGVQVTNTPDVLTEATADVAFGLILAAARRFGEGMAAGRAGRWKWAQGLLWGQDVYGATLGIIGLGRIGAAVARRARGFSMRVLYHSRRRRPDAETELGAEYRDLPDLLAEADFVSLHCPLTPETRHLLDDAALARMKPTAMVINTGRGPLIDQAALLRAVREGRLAGAGLDVTDPEPPSPDDPILADPRIVVTPHLGSASVPARTAMTRVCITNLLASLRGEPPPNWVNRT